MDKDRKDDNQAGPRRTGAGPDNAPQDRTETLQAHAERRKDEPAAAPMETDAESGGASGPQVGPGPHSVPAHEVRAGPGDAGAQDAPEVLPKTPRTTKASAARIGPWFAVPLAILLALYWAMTV